MPTVRPTRGCLRRGWSLLLLLLALVAGALGSYWMLRRWLRRPAPVPEEGRPFVPPVSGLTEAEAAARQSGVDLDRLARAEHLRFLGRAIWKNLFTTFNIDLFSIGILMLVLGSPLSTLGSLFILLMNLVLNVFQEVYTKIKLDRLVRSLRPQATVIREGQIKSIDPVEVVAGDMLVVGPGDEIPVDGEIVGDGQILVEESPHDQPEGQTLKWVSDPVRAGSYCVDGRAVYRAGDVDPSRLARAGSVRVELLSGERTPLQRLIEYVLRALFVLVILFSVLLVLDSTVLKLELLAPAYREAFSIIFGIAPTSLFFILIVQYGVGSLRMANLGALVYRSGSIEALANVSVLCLSLGSLLSGVQVRLAPIPPPAGQEPLSERLVRRMLGDCLHSLPTYTPADSMLSGALPGARRTPLETAPFLSLHGWHAMTFNDPDLRGTFVIGEPAVLAPHLARAEMGRQVGHTLTRALHGLGRVPAWLRRNEQPGQVETATPEQTSAVLASEEQLVPGSRKANSERPVPDWLSEDVAKPSRLQRFGNWLERTIGPREETPAGESQDQQPRELGAWLFAYVPDVAPLYDSHGQALLPANLVPLARVHVAESVRPEARQTIRAFLDAGVSIKILASDDPARAASMATALDLEAKPAAALSGNALAATDREAFARAVCQAAVFGDLTPTQKADILCALREEGEYVAMVGDSPGDVLAMRQANLKLALHGGSQAAVMAADVVLLKDSLEALPLVLKTGQRLVNGVLDTFKLYLSQVSMQLLLIVVIALLRLGHYPYNATQAGVVSVFTISFPVILLAVWSSAGVVSEESIRRRLARFLVPVAITLSILAMVVYVWFLARIGDTDYAQLGVTYALLGAGWLRLLFVLPPTPAWVGGAQLRGDRRVFGLILFMVVFFLFVQSFPLLREWLYIEWLRPATDYLIVALVVAVWAIGVRAVWRARLMEPIINFFAQRLRVA
jgi:magnesium-transporting ATPase (P-type)